MSTLGMSDFQDNLTMMAGTDQQTLDSDSNNWLLPLITAQGKRQPLFSYLFHLPSLIQPQFVAHTQRNLSEDD